jgi:formamidopyrimidine-DNA glycosylase
LETSTFAKRCGAPAYRHESVPQGLLRQRFPLLAQSIQEVLKEAIVAGGSSLRDHRKTNGDLGYFQKEFAVYDREGESCMRLGCSGIVRRIVQSGRSTFYCPICQK